MIYCCIFLMTKQRVGFSVTFPNRAKFWYEKASSHCSTFQTPELSGLLLITSYRKHLDCYLTMCCQLLVCVPLLYPLGSRQEKASQTFHIANLYEPTVLLTSHYLETMAITGGKTFFNYIQGYSNSFKKKLDKNIVCITSKLYTSLHHPSAISALQGIIFLFFSLQACSLHT